VAVGRVEGGKEIEREYTRIEMYPSICIPTVEKDRERERERERKRERERSSVVMATVSILAGRGDMYETIRS